MRGLLLAAVMMATTAGAVQAADMPDFLRGSLPAEPVAPTHNWDGWYVGGQVGESWANTDYGSTVVGITNNIFRNTELAGPASQFNVLGRVNGQSSGFGGFVGRNYQFDDIVVGVEANYSYISSLATSTSGSLGPIQVVQPGLVFPANFNGAAATSYFDNVTLNGNAALRLKDELTFRGRVGWATGDFLPYAFGGLAVGRMDVSRTVQSTVNRTVNYADGTLAYYPLPQYALTTTDGRDNNYVLGWTAGLGLEYCLWGNVFLRGEYEYVKFMEVKNTVVTQNSVRAGIGYKF